jgi:transposase
VKKNRRKNLDLITPATLVVGVDGHSKSNTAAFCLASGDEPMRPMKFSNDRSGFVLFLEKVKWVMRKNGLTDTIFVLEPNGPYWFLLARFLEERNYTVKVVNPLQVKRNRQTENPSPDKNDSRDARSAADLGRQGKFNQTNLPSQTYEDLRTLARLREGVMEERSMQKHRLRASLVRAFPELSRCVSDICGKGSVALLRVAPTAGAVVSMGEAGIAQALKEGSKGRLGMKKAREIVRMAKESVGYTAATPALRIEFGVILDVMDFLSSRLELIESEMKRLLWELDEAILLVSIPGIGEVTAATILGETGGLSCFDNPSQIRKLAGFDLVGSQSGEYEGRLKISKRGRKILRKALYQCAVSSLHCNQALRRFYDGLISSDRPNRLKKKQAVVAVAGKLVDIMFSLVRTGDTFDPEHKWSTPAKNAIDVLEAVAA